MTGQSTNSRFVVCSYGTNACVETTRLLQDTGWTLVAGMGLPHPMLGNKPGMPMWCDAMDPVLFERAMGVHTTPKLPGWLTAEQMYCLLQTFDRHLIDTPIEVDERLERGLRLLNGWTSLLEREKPSFCLFDDAPHFPHDYALYLAAQALGIKTFMFQYGPSVRHMTIVDSVEGSALVPHTSLVDRATIDSQIGTMGKSETPPEYITKQKKDAAIFKRRHGLAALLLNSVRENLRLARGWKIAPAGWSLLSYGKRPFGWKQRNLMPWQVAWLMRGVQQRNHTLQQKYRRIASAALPSCFVYVPLHYQPEATTMPLAGWWSNQIAFLQTLAAQLPDGWSIVTKEHPTTFKPHLFGYQGRRANYYEDIAAIPGVHIAQEDISSHLLTQKAKFVLTLRGTASWEALNMGQWGFFTHPNWFTLHPGLIVAPETAITECLKRIDAPPPGGQAVLESMAPFLIPNDRVGHTDMDRTAAIVVQTLLNAMGHPHPTLANLGA